PPGAVRGDPRRPAHGEDRGVRLLGVHGRPVPHRHRRARRVRSDHARLRRLIGGSCRGPWARRGGSDRNPSGPRSAACPAGRGPGTSSARRYVPLSTTEQPAAPPIEIPTSDGGTLLVPRQRVWIGNVSNGNHSTHFTRSLAGLVEFDRSRGLGLWGGALYQESGANISKGRNELVTKALAIPELEWLLLLDSDMVF